jgi:hypothetical protein
MACYLIISCEKDTILMAGAPHGGLTIDYKIIWPRFGQKQSSGWVETLHRTLGGINDAHQGEGCNWPRCHQSNAQRDKEENVGLPKEEKLTRGRRRKPR